MSTSEGESGSLSEGSPASVRARSKGSADDPDSGVAMNGDCGNISIASSTNTAHHHPPSLKTRGPVGGANGFHPTPLTDFRRPSIVEMMNNGGLVISKRGSCEINLENVLAEDVEMMYAHHGGRRGSQPSQDCEGSWVHHSTEEGGSSVDLSGDPAGCLSRASRCCWPAFNSPILERHWRRKVVEFLRRRFRIAVMFIALFSLLWIVFFSVHLPFNPPRTQQESETRINDLAIYSVRYTWWYVAGGATVFALVAVLLMLTFSKYYQKISLLLSILLSLLLMFCSFALVLALYFDPSVEGFSTISFVAQFTITAVVVLIIFTLSRLPMWLSLILNITYLCILEVLVALFTYGLQTKQYPRKLFIHTTTSRALFHLCLLLAGVSTAYLSQVRLHATFWKIAQCVLSQKALELERDLEERTILSMMPKPFADELMELQVQLAFMVKAKVGQEGDAQQLDPMFQSITTPFTICSMEGVTILFADIVDFTEFSSTLSAAELVGILNEVFSIFDELVPKHKCEKISTLGDCYFCVSGCPEPISGHADNCVDMGLSIVDALDAFREKTGLPLEMRVGIHTGSVFCGVMGTKRFKFDVWSRDVKVAKNVESVGTPGRVLVSAVTNSFLSSAYVVEEANIHHQLPELEGLPMYYVVGRRNRAMAAGTSVMEWKRKIQNIDTVCKHDPEGEAPPSPPTVQKSSPSLWKRKKAPQTPKMKTMISSQSSSSIVDIFSRQTQLQHCTSYAELADPQKQQEAVTDQKIVDLMKEQKVDFDTYFDPQLKIISLQFHDPNWEAAYRNYGRDLDDGSNGKMTETELGFRITKLSYLIDTVTLLVIYILLMAGSAISLSSDNTFNEFLWSWLGTFLVGLIVEVVILIHVLAVFVPRLFPAWFAKYAQIILNWYVRSVVSLFLIYYPMTIAYVSIAQCQGTGIETLHGLAHVQMSFFVTIVVLISSINFMEVSHVVKFIGGALSATISIVMVATVHLNLCISRLPASDSVTPTPTQGMNATDERPTFMTESPRSYLTGYYTRHVTPEAVILLLLILIILMVVNRMSEVSVRLSFLGRIEAAVRRRHTRQKKTQAEWLLFNIIPPHVALKLRKTGNYSQDHECVSVIFASIVNFSDFHRQTDGSGEMESLRLLNQIVTEFDALLDKPRFANVEKIKTIGSTYMAASGLDLPPNEPCTVNHLLELIDFAQQLIEVLEAVNQQIDGFTFRMRIGFNYGPVTSGVVGIRKMLYDIWGDTVNVASRMEATGIVNKIHMPERCLRQLGPHVTCEFHKVVNVKGKGQMRTVFVTRSEVESNTRTTHVKLEVRDSGH